MKILFLTKNILAEQQLQEQLQMLGYEVFVSSSEFNKGLRCSFSEEIMNCFDIIILGENLANNEVKILLSNLIETEKMVIRISSSQVKEEIEQVHYINTANSIDQMREKLASSVRVPKRKKEELELSEMLFFSKKEQLLFDYIKANSEKIISRENLCEYLWKEELTTSRKSHMSSLVKKINSKLQSQSNTNEIIETVWGKGYTYSKAKESLVMN